MVVVWSIIRTECYGRRSSPSWSLMSAALICQWLGGATERDFMWFHVFFQWDVMVHVGIENALRHRSVICWGPSQRKWKASSRRRQFKGSVSISPRCWYMLIYVDISIYISHDFFVSCLISESPIFWTILKLQQATPKRVGGDHCRRQVDIEGTGCIDWEQFRSFIHNEHVPWWGIRLMAEIWDCGEIKVYVCRLVRIVSCQPQLIKTTVWTEFQSRILS
jgi:hypothetical protein